MIEPGDDASCRRPEWPLLALLGLWTLGVAQPLLEAIASAPEFLVAHRWLGSRLAGSVFALVFLPPLLLWAAERLVEGVSRVASTALHRLWITSLAWFLALLVARQVKLDGVTWVVFGVVAALASVAAYVRFRAFRAFVRLLALAAIAVPVVFLLSAGIRPLVMGAPSESALDSRLRTSADATAPIVWIVFDEWALSTILTPEGELDSEVFPNLSALAAESTWYRRAASVSGATELAVPAILGGTLPAPEELPVPAHRPTHLFNLLPHYEIWAQEVVSFLAAPERNRAEQTKADGTHDSNRTGEILAFESNAPRELLSDLRWLYLHRLVPDGWRHWLPPVSDRWRGFGGGAEAEDGVGEEREAVVQRFLPAFQDRLRADRMAAFEQFLAALGPEERRLYFLHLLLPHTPYRYLPNGRRYSITTEHVPGLVGERWGSSQARVDQAHQRYLLQVRLLDRLVGRLVTRLNEVGIYDRAALVLVSDHGISFRAGELRRTATTDNADELLSVPLFVKAPGQREGRVVKEPFSLVDLLPTVLDLVDPGAGPRPRESMTWQDGLLPLVNVGGREWLDPAFLDRQRPTTETHHGRFTRPPAAEIPAMLRFRELVGRSVDEIGWAPVETPAVVLDERLLPFGVGSPLLRGRLLEPPDECCDLAVVLSGRVAATLSVEAGLEPIFSIVLPTVSSAGRPTEKSSRPRIYSIVTSGDSVGLGRLPVLAGTVPDTETTGPAGQG
ncbi:MAG: sulfatase-like hydrolase/transferase [Thermoanaerobaculia bacterium]|nr:sulfatase-like hydrolase/transferase [Thermoanaerobaculia bacterium]